MNGLPLETGKSAIKQYNVRRILSELLFNGPQARSDLTVSTELTMATVSRLCRQLVDAGLLIENDPTPSPDRPGRRTVNLDFNPDGPRIIGVSINAYQQTVSIANLKNKVLSQRSLELSRLTPADDVLDKIADTIEEVIAETKVDRASILGIGVTSAGAVDSDLGVVRWAPTLNWKDVAVYRRLSQRLNFGAYITNIPNCLNLAEAKFGIGRGCQSIALINGALGIGLSLFLDRRLIHGSDFQAGVLDGHSFFLDENGNRLTVPQAAGGQGVIRMYDDMTGAQTAKPFAQQLTDILKACLDGEKKAVAAVAQAGRNLGRVFELVEGLTHPDLLILSGPLSTCDVYVTAVRNYLDMVWQNRLRQPRFMLSTMSNDEAARLLAINEFLLFR